LQSKAPVWSQSPSLYLCLRSSAFSSSEGMQPLQRAGFLETRPMVPLVWVAKVLLPSTCSTTRHRSRQFVITNPAGALPENLGWMAASKWILDVVIWFKLGAMSPSQSVTDSNLGAKNTGPWVWIG
jgi:hypothetical protein